MPINPQPPDIDPQETEDWLDSLEAVLHHHGGERARYLLQRLSDRAAWSGVSVHTRIEPYTNSIAARDQPPYPGNLEIEHRIRSLIRWNAMAMVVRANRKAPELGGHLSSFAAAAELYEVGFNHYFRAPSDGHGGDMVFVQGHSAPGIYARSFLDGRLSENDLDGFRQEVDGGLTSYPHPWLMPEYWQFATVSMGLGPMMAIYQARFLRYLENRGLTPPSDRKVWAFLGDGEMDEPESLGAITVAAREGLDNLVFVVSCNLQRLDGPVRGNGSIVRELESLFHGAGWNVQKVLWGSAWDEWLDGPHGELIVQRMEEAVDGDYQAYAADAADGKGTLLREHFFGRYPELVALVDGLSEEQIASMPMHRGGHDPIKVNAAYAAASAHRGQPTIILAKTIKGFGLGDVAQAKNVSHQAKKLADDAVIAYRDWLQLDISDEQASNLEYITPAADSEEAQYARQRRAALGGNLPARQAQAAVLKMPDEKIFATATESSGKREFSTTMAFVRLLAGLLRDEAVGNRVVPIVADEARTFGMDGLFRQVGIYAPHGQLYTPVDREMLSYYREAKDGQILQEGLSEGGAFCSWIAAGTAAANHDLPMIPFYIYYSMFGFQRIGDLAWAAADMQARGFLLGATAGRTTLAGEGLQHQDGHSHVLATTIPTCRAYDPTYAYELAVIIRDGLQRMYVDGDAAFYYLTLMNENYTHPAMPAGCEEGILRGMYMLRQADGGDHRVQLMGSGAILREVEAAAVMLRDEFDIAADVWSATSFTELRRQAMGVRRANRLHPEAARQSSFVENALEPHAGPVVAASDYMESYAEQIRPFVPRRFSVLGTDGFGRSDTRKQLRRFFEVDRQHIVVAALKALADDGDVEAKTVGEAIRKYDIDPEAADPAHA